MVGQLGHFAAQPLGRPGLRRVVLRAPRVAPGRRIRAEQRDYAGLGWVLQLYIGDVEPLLMPLLIRVHELSGQILGAGLPADGGSAALARLVHVGLELNGRIFPPQTEVQLIAEESLTKHDKTCVVENQIGGGGVMEFRQ